jgi:protein TonB
LRNNLIDRISGDAVQRDRRGVAATLPEVSLPDEPTADLVSTANQAILCPPRKTAEAGASMPASRRSPIRGSSNRGMIVTLLVSLGLHLAALMVVLLLLHTGAPMADGPEQPTEVELVMEEHKGDLRPNATSPQVPAEARPKADHSTETPASPVPAPIESKAEVPAAAEPAMAPDPARKQATPTPDAAATAQSVPQAAQQGLTVTLSGTDSPSDARAWGDRIIPAAPDAVFHNRPPEYPAEAALNGEQGTVVLMIHVSPEGSTAGVDVLRSSGYALLDRAAREAVLRWRFLPAVKDGQAVASDMRMGFVFDVR